MKQLTAILAITLMLASCNQYDKSKSGMPYKIKKGGSTAKLKQGQFLKFNIEYIVSNGNKDSVLNSSYGHIPAYMRYDTAQAGKYNFTEVLNQASVGDKIEFTLSIDSLKNMGMIPDYNGIFKKGGAIKGKVDLIAVFDTEELVRADVQKEEEVEKQKEIKALEAYMSKKGIKAQKTSGGAFVELTNAGDATLKADSGKQVSVMYKGYTEDGKEFDSNIGKPGATPLNVVIGSRSVIAGWEEGLRFFGKGGKGRILVPAMLGYGQQAAGPNIPPYSNLIFDVEIVDVTTPAPPPPTATPPAPTKK